MRHHLSLLWKVENAIQRRLGRNVMLDDLSVMQLEQLNQALSYNDEQLEKTLNEILA